MQTNCTYIPYKSTGYFSKLVLDYLEGKDELKEFYTHPVSIAGIESSIKQRQLFANNRKLLVDELQKQYAGIELNELQQTNLNNLLSNDCFTVCTAHQPNIFTGHLYFVYKILHAVKLSQTLATQLPQYKFVPVFYMGSEDADLDELGNIELGGQKLEWKTQQTGAVGRMVVDPEFLKLIDSISGQVSIHSYGGKLVELFRDSYKFGTSIQQATLLLVHELFKAYGLLILIPDNANLKRPFNDVVRKELVEQFSHSLVEETAGKLAENYKVQASGRDINLFYLTDNSRERIQKTGDRFHVNSVDWTEDEILLELDKHPERFSANVILRGVFQEMILPNVAFIGGGGEIAYWLELKKVFQACAVPFPVLVVRNSFLLVDKKSSDLADKLGFQLADTFKSGKELATEIVKRKTALKLDLSDELVDLHLYYSKLKQQVALVDVSLTAHVMNLQKKAERSISHLQKKMLRAETKKFEAELRQVAKLKQQLFPNDSLQERVENFIPYYSKYGPAWFDSIINASKHLDGDFCVISK